MEIYKCSKTDKISEESISESNKLKAVTKTPNIENVFTCWEKNLQIISQFIKKQKNTEIKAHLATLNLIIKKYSNHILSNALFIQSIEKNNFVYQILNLFVELKEDSIIQLILQFFTQFSLISGDFINLYLPFFWSNNFFPIILNQVNKLPSLYIQLFYSLLGIISEYSDDFINYLMNISFIKYSINLFQQSEDFNLKIQILNFINKMADNCSQNINFRNFSNEFLSLISFLKKLYNDIIHNQISIAIEPKKEIFLLILDFFENIFLISEIKDIFFDTNISQFIFDSFEFFDMNNEFYNEIFPLTVELFEFGFEYIQFPENFKNLHVFLEKIFFFLNNNSFWSNISIVRSLISIINSSNNDYFIFFFNENVYNILKDYQDSDVEFSNLIILLVDRFDQLINNKI